MAYIDEIERFQVEVLRLGGEGITNDIMRRIIREAIEKWDQWNVDKWKKDMRKKAE